jgi:hypothetical protein
MATPSPASVEARMAALEQQMQQLRARLAAVEQLLANPPGEHPVDQSVVRKKVTYDWQA